MDLSSTIPITLEQSLRAGTESSIRKCSTKKALMIADWYMSNLDTVLRSAAEVIGSFLFLAARIPDARSTIIRANVAPITPWMGARAANAANIKYFR